MENLIEKYDALINSDKMPEINESAKGPMSVILENQSREQSTLVEGTLSGDIAKYNKIFMPMVRLAMPELVGNHIVGVQPLAGPTGFIYAAGFKYVGSASTAKLETTEVSFIVKTEEDNSEELDAVVGDFTVIYVKGNLALVKAPEGTEAPKVGDELGGVITGVYSNSMFFGKLLPEYAGPYTTADGEKLGEDMPEVAFSVTQTSVSAVSRKLKALYTVEMLQDLQAMHGLAGEKELMTAMASELKFSIDREIIRSVNTWATPSTDLVVQGFGSTRFDAESFNHFAFKVIKEANDIAITTHKGAGNVLICSPTVGSMIEGLDAFKGLTGGTLGGSKVIGTYLGKKVIVDVDATTDYMTVLYKGTSAQDAIGFYSPYVAVWATPTVDPVSGQPALILGTRSAVTENPNNAQAQYGRRFEIDFTGTVLA